MYFLHPRVPGNVPCLLENEFMLNGDLITKRNIKPKLSTNLLHAILYISMIIIHPLLYIQRY